MDYSQERFFCSLEFVDSSSIAAIGTAVVQSNKATVLMVEFKSGQRYVYPEASHNLIEQTKKAPSAGIFFDREIKKKHIGHLVKTEFCVGTTSFAKPKGSHFLDGIEMDFTL